MRWRQKFHLLATLFSGKKKRRKMLKYGKVEPEAAQEGHDKESQVPEDFPKKEVTWHGCGAEDQRSLQHSSDSMEPEDEVFEEESVQRKQRTRFRVTSDPPSDCNSDECIQAVSSKKVYTASDLGQGTIVTSQIPSITVEHSNYQEHNQESTPRRTFSEAPTMEMNQSAKGSVAFLNGDNEKSENVKIDACADSPNYDQKFRKLRWRGRRSDMSRIKVKYTKVYGESDGAYKNDSTPRGLVFMCNFSKFKNNEYSDRKGSHTDFENMFLLFHQMGYDVNHRKGKFCQSGYITKKVFMENLRTFSKDQKLLSLCSCVIIIMSHGSGPKTFISSDNEDVDLMEVYSIFDNVHCEYLRGKPKLFILQFCRNTSSDLSGRQSKRPSENLPVDVDLLRMVVREEIRRFQNMEQDQHQQWNGDDTDGTISPQSPVFLATMEHLSRNTSVASFSSLIEPSTSQVAGETECRGSSRALDNAAAAGGGSGTYHTDTRNVVMLPHEGVQRYSDMYSIFSTSSGELSHRDPHKGSLLIQAICHVFADCAYQDEIDTLVRKVSMYMTRTLQKNDPITVPRQTCERTNNGLDKYFYFNPQEGHFPRNVTI